MPRQRTPLEAAAGQLISAIQKEWTAELGEPCAAGSEHAMNQAHELLQAAVQDRLPQLLQGRTIAAFLGCHWVAAHPGVLPAIKAMKQHC